MENKKVKKDETKVKGKVTIENKKSNKNTKWIIIGIVAVIAVIVIVIAITSYLKTPYFAVKKSLNAIKNGKIEIINEYLSYDELMNSLIKENDARSETSDIDKKCFEKLEYKINSVKVEENTAKVTIETTNINFRNVLSKLSQNFLSKIRNGEEISNEQGKNLLKECLSDESVGTMSVSKEITLYNEDGKWKVQIDENLIDSIFPGLNEVANSLELILSE